MRYLVTTDKAFAPFLTDYFYAPNHFNPDVDMVVFDLINMTYTTDGINWIDINEDHL